MANATRAAAAEPHAADPQSGETPPPALPEYSRIVVRVDRLDRSPFNIGKKHSKDEIAKMAVSIRYNGIINPPAVVAGKKGRYEYLAGDLRISGARKAGLAEIPVHLYDNVGNADLVALSLAENADRDEMSEVQQYQAFSKLAKEGMDLGAIAARFNVEVLTVRQRLAIGTLPQKVLDIAGDKEDAWYDDDDGTTLTALTLATPAQLDAWLALESWQRPMYGPDIRKWLAKDSSQVKLKHALFDRVDYTGSTITDLFDDAGETDIATDGTLFWKLQEEKIAEQIAKLEAAGWTVERVDKWEHWRYSVVAKKDGGKAYVVVQPSGEVIVKKGFLSAAEARNKRGGAPGKGTTTGSKPELSNPMRIYMNALRLTALQDGIMDDVDVALALTITLIMTHARHWRTDIETFSGIRNDALIESVKATPHRRTVTDTIERTYAQLGHEGDGYCFEETSPQLFRDLMQYDRESLLEILARVTADRFCLPWGDDKLGTAVAEALGWDAVPAWEPDEAFWAGIKNRETMAQLIDHDIVGGNPIDTSKGTLKQLREDAAAEAQHQPDWRPRWLRFPPQAYTKDHGLGFVDDE